MKKLLVLLVAFCLFQSVGIAKDSIVFSFPNDGWHKVQSPDRNENKKCFVPSEQSTETYREMVTIIEKTIKSPDISPMVIMSKQIGKDKNNYPDIVPVYVYQTMDDSMAAWCSRARNVCAVERVFKGNDGVILAIYLNKAPHYSQNMFGQWTNILSQMTIYDENYYTEEQPAGNIIEL